LGVTPSAELAVIKAVYKALANKYHPDKHTGNKAQAEAKMREINEAYEVLSDSANRAAYDAARNKADEAAFEETDESFKNAEDTLSEIIKSDWSVAEKYYPDIKECVDSLKKISRSLVLPFKIYLLEEQSFSAARAISEGMIEKYLKNYFGRNEKIIAYARQLLMDGDLLAAKELNRVVRVLGKDIEPSTVIDNITAEFKTSTWNGEDYSYEARAYAATENEINKNTSSMLKVFLAFIVIFIVLASVVSSCTYPLV
jgi:hypothetical protein